MLHELVPHMELSHLVRVIGYPGLFAVVFLESGIPFGFFLPGASMLFIAGLLASKGFFSVWILVPLVTVAAILGDNAGYWIGSAIGVRLFTHGDSRFFKHEHFEQAKEFYEHHGTRMVALARFVPVVRTFAPIVAGVVQMRYRVFLTYNIIGALAWGAGVTTLGYFLAERVPLIQDYLTPIILIIVIVTTVPLFFEWKKSRK